MTFISVKKSRLFVSVTTGAGVGLAAGVFPADGVDVGVAVGVTVGVAEGVGEPPMEATGTPPPPPPGPPGITTVH